MAASSKEAVHDFWQQQACGEVYATGTEPKERFEHHERARYSLEPYLKPFAKFETAKDLDVLEIGVGMGADHLQLARAKPRRLEGVDLTGRAVELTAERLRAYDFTPSVRVADAESLPFPDNSFDLVYSWGVLHHSPNTPRAIQEVHRVLKPGGVARIMIYHHPSIVGYMLWLRYGLLRGKLALDRTEIYGTYLESPGTKAYRVSEAREMFTQFASADFKVQLSLGDLLRGEVGQRHKSAALNFAKRVWPRWAIRALLPNCGLFLLIQAIK